MKYYIYQYIEDTWTCIVILNDYNDLIRYFSRHQQYSHYYWKMNKHDAYWYDCFGKRHYNNKILDEINMSGKDISYDTKGFYKDGVYYSEKIAYIRPYMIFDEKDRTVDVRLFYKDIINYKSEPYRRYYWGRTGSKCVWDSRRSVKRGHIIRMINHPDFQEYGRKRPYILMDKWDYPYKHCDRSWKTSYKCRKQWMKNAK